MQTGREEWIVPDVQRGWAGQGSTGAAPGRGAEVQGRLGRWQQANGPEKGALIRREISISSDKT